MTTLPLGPFMLILGQNSGGTLPPMENAAGTTTTPGTATGENGQAAPEVSPFSGMLPLLLIMVVVVVGMSMFSGRKEKKRKARLMATMGKNDSVQTIGGIIGRVIEVKPDRVVLEVDRNSNSRVTISKQAVQQVLESADAPSTDDDDDTTD